MAKVIDITDKLSFDGAPKLKIKEKEIEVNADAPTILKIMGLMNKDGDSVANVMESYDLLFPSESKTLLDELKLGFNDFIAVIKFAIELVTGETSRGE